jgi:predicted ATPase/DNA-binding CsgD family transcriptional regulator
VATQDQLVGRVPVPAASIVGRDRLADAVVEIVLSNRVVTLMGVGGVGKTRLAVEAAGRLTDRFSDGVWMIELAPVGDPDAVPAAIANSLGVTPQGDGAVIDAVSDAVAGRRMLLVLDNCEHLAQATASAIQRILERSPTPHILATSRESLWVAGEQRVSVSPLDLDGGTDSDAATLFVERARAVRLGFGVDDAPTADAVIEICRTLDGLPLAIELAAARMASMSAIELRDRLEHRFRLLTGADHRPERQRTLEAMVAWSYDLLGDDERHVLLAASVFTGGFDLAGLVELTDGADEVGVLTLLDALVHRSLVVADPRDGATRYRLLETIRQFATDRLAVDGDGETIRDRHAALFGHAAAARWERWNGPGWRSASEWVETELSNLRTAFRWSVGRGDFDVATDVAAHAALIGAPAQLFETVTWAEELLDAATRADVARLPRLYTGAGFACFAGRPVSAAVHAHTATELETDPRYDPCEPGLAMFVEALARVYSGDLDRYVELAERVARLPGSARAYGLPAYVDGLQASGRVEEALALSEESVAAARNVGNPFWIAYALWTAGLAHANTDTQRALAAWNEGVDVVQQHRVDFFEGLLARDAARVHATAGEPDVALELFATAIESFQQAGNIAQLIITVALVPAVFEQLGHLEAAATLCAAITREPASVDHVHDLVDLSVRLEASLGQDEATRCSAIGSELDLNAAATYARGQIEIIRAELAHALTDEPPGGLSRRELEVLRLIADGLSTREIAGRLFISAKTADHHIQHIYTKLAVSNRAAATRWAIDHDVSSATTA